MREVNGFAAICFISRSLDASAIESEEIDSSSQSFELGLIKAMSTIVPVHVYNVAERVSETVNKSQPNLEYSAVGRCGLFSPLLVLFKVIFSKKNGRVAILTTGYLPMEMLALGLARLFGITVFSIIYDTHIPALDRMGAWKRIFANMYFGLGFWLVRALDGIIVLNEIFVRERGLGVPFLKTRVGAVVLDRQGVKVENSPSRPLRLLFAGTMNADNGVKLILDGFQKLNDDSIVVVFCGDGELFSDVVAASESDQRIVWLGRVSDSRLNDEIAASDYLLCLRDPTSSSCSYSFPSKLIKFMASGKPVIVNLFPGLPTDCNGYLRLLRDYSSESLVDEISNLDRQSDQWLAEEAARVVRTRHNWIDIAHEIVDFMRLVPSNFVRS